MTYIDAPRLTIGQVRASTAKQVALMGRDFQYVKPNNGATCFYQPATDENYSLNDPRRKTGCLVGRILADIAPAYYMKIKASVHGIGDLFSLNYPYDHAVRRYLSHLQGKQDRGGVWGYVYDETEAWYTTYGGLDCNPDAQYKP